MSEWLDNPGTMPGQCAGKRIYVELRNGMRPEASWPADGRDGARWKFSQRSKRSNAFDIIRYRLA